MRAHRPLQVPPAGLAVLLMALTLLAAAFAPALADSPSALSYLGLGDDAYRMGDLAEAARQWSQAIEICRIAPNPAVEMQAKAKRGEALQALGYMPDAIKDLNDVYRQALAERDPERVAQAAGALGNAYFHAHHPAKARPLLEQSLLIARERHDVRIVAASANNLGNLDAASGDDGAAEATYDEAVVSASAAGDAHLVVTALTNKARVLGREGRLHESTAVLAKALAGTGAIRPSHDRVFALLAIGRLAENPAGTQPAQGADTTLAYRALEAAAHEAEDLKDRRGASLAYGYLAALYQQAGQPADALALAQKAISRARDADATDLLYRWEWETGRALKQLGDIPRAIEAYRRAVADLQSARPDIPIDYHDGHSSFRETIGPLYFEAADLLLRRSAEMTGAARAPLLDEARHTIELLKAAELRDYFRDPCITSLQATRGPLEGAQHAAALYPVVLPDRLELLLRTDKGETQVTVPIDRARLVAEVRRFRRRLEDRTTREFLIPAQRLYAWLIAPLESVLEADHIHTLVFVPDGALRTIPLAALYDGKEFVVQKYAVATAPGLSLVEQEKRGPEAEHRVLLAGLSEGVQGFPPLPRVTSEIRAIRRVEGGDVLENSQFRVASIIHDLETTPYSIVHIASHGEFSSDPDKSFILAYDGKLTMDRLEETVKLSQYREGPLDLLTLSACETAAGDDRAALGLAGVAIRAGARSALASLWFVSDEAAAALAAKFYEELQLGVTKAEALRRAQLALLADRRYRHPAYWSGFLLIGSWQ